ncbi:MAG: alpha/beta fold hydrolase [Acidobacteriota bacterium]
MRDADTVGRGAGPAESTGAGDPGGAVPPRPDGETLLPDEEFRPAWWLPGPHLQTVWGTLTRRRRGGLDYRRERLPTPDGDEIWIDHVDGPEGAPRLVVLHGLEGSSYSVYVQGLLETARARGWRGAAVNFRSCARDPNRLGRWVPNLRPRLYHSGETSDFGHVVSHLAAADPGSPLVAAGASLGGNVLLKWLGENPGQTLVRAAATLSVPYDLGAGARYMERGLGPHYLARFLSTLRAKAEDLAARFPEAARRLDLPRARAAKTFTAFDDAATAPLHGFTGAGDYYARSSSIGFVSQIRTPTLCVSSEDDPFLPRSVLDEVRERASPAVQLRRTSRGGHIGFVGGGAGPRFWAERAAVDWLAGRLEGR